MKFVNALAATLVIVGALNWGLVALAGFDLVAEIFGLEFGETNAATRVIYGLVGLAGAYSLWALVATRGSRPRRAAERCIVTSLMVHPPKRTGPATGANKHKSTTKGSFVKRVTFAIVAVIVGVFALGVGVLSATAGSSATPMATKPHSHASHMTAGEGRHGVGSARAPRKAAGRARRSRDEYDEPRHYGFAGVRGIREGARPELRRAFEVDRLGVRR